MSSPPVTPERSDAEVDAEEPTTSRPARIRWDRIAGLGAALAIVALPAIWLTQSSSQVESTSAAAAGAPATAATTPRIPSLVIPSAAVTPPASTATAPSAAPASAGEGAIIGPVANVDEVADTVVAAGSGPVYGQPVNGQFTYTVEVEKSLVDQLPELVKVTDTAFSNTTEGWTARDEVSLQRISDPAAATIRIVLASPKVVDETCGRAGMDTAGLYSCWDGAHTMLNSDRWFHATPEFANLATYRTYLINHEFGHGLGHDHEYCASPGAVAPVMQQQSISLQGCTPNGWPLPGGQLVIGAPAPDSGVAAGDGAAQ